MLRVLKDIGEKGSVTLFTCVDIAAGEEVLPLPGGQRDVREPHRRGEREGHREPDESARQEAPDTLARLGRHAALPVRLVHEHSPKVPYSA